MSDNLPPIGAAGAAPPPDAPHEVSQPLAATAGARVIVDRETGATRIVTPLERARENERELAPLHYGAPVQPPRPGEAVPTTGGIGEATRAAAEGQLDPFYARMRDAQQLPTEVRVETSAITAGPGQPVRRILRRPTVQRPSTDADLPNAPTDRPAPDPGSPRVDTAPPAQAVTPAAPAAAPRDPNAPIDLTIRATAPAASDTDSPTRGIPRNLPTDPGKAIVGGFGDAAALAYFALDGHELGVLVLDLLDQLAARIPNDLRFNEALCYPQVTARVVVEISGFARDTAFVVDRVLPPSHPARATNPIEFARTVADEVAFVLVEECRETDPAGESVLPPDAMRDRLGLDKPRKQIIRTGAGAGQVAMVDKR